MSVRVPPDNFIDKIIAILGGRKKVFTPDTDIAARPARLYATSIQKARKGSVFESFSGSTIHVVASYGVLDNINLVGFKG